MKCRCGGKAARRCVACGSGVDGERCRAHPTANVEIIRCFNCAKPLCHWHYSLVPTSRRATTSSGAPQDIVVLQQACFPGCASAFRDPEWRPDGKTDTRVSPVPQNARRA